MLKQLLITIALVSFFSAFTIAQEKTDNKEKKEHTKGCCSGHESHGNMSMTSMNTDSTKVKQHEMKSDHKMHGMHKEMKSESMSDDSIIREGLIDLVAIDANGDGMVYQDQMCWNVISDEAGECPQCGMILKEVSLEKAKENLQKNDYQVK
ncbi:MAG: hypothetical protein Kow0098_23350 [Ignavibacteriaceae bacterium]